MTDFFDTSSNISFELSYDWGDQGSLLVFVWYYLASRQSNTLNVHAGSKFTLKIWQKINTT